MFFQNVWYFRVLNFFFISLNNTRDFFHFNLFRNYLKHFSIILSFFSYSLGENKLVYSNKLLPFNIKSVNKLAPNVAASIPRNLPFYSFTLFSNVSLTPSINKPVCSRDLTILWRHLFLHLKSLVLFQIQKFSFECLHLLLKL